jgi:hypothetical protein
MYKRFYNPNEKKIKSREEKMRYEWKEKKPILKKIGVKQRKIEATKSPGQKASS